MRRIHVENARRRQRSRHVGGLDRVDVEEVEISDGNGPIIAELLQRPME